MLRTDNPVDMNVSIAPEVLMLGMNTLNINAQTEFGIATLSMDGEVIGSAYVENGQATIEFEPLSNIGTAKLVVIGYNKVTYETDIEILPAEGAYITIDSYNPHNAHVGDETSLTLVMKNVGVEATPGTTNVVIASENENISFGNASGSFGVLEADATTNVSGFTFTIANNVADGTIIPISVTSTCGGDTYTSNINITAGRAALDFDGYTWKGSFTPGETFNVTAKFKNVGHYQSENAVATISSENEYITFANEAVEYGTIMPGDIAYCIFTVTISSECPTTEAIPLLFNITDAEENMAEGDGELTNSCNVVFDLHDSYGDGWNNCYLSLSFSDGSQSQNLTISDGDFAQHVISVATGTTVTVQFHNGSYAYETSYEVYYEGESNDPIHTDAGSGYSGPSTTAWNFTANCAGDDSGDLSPVLNLTANVENNNDAVLTWEDPVTEPTPTTIGVSSYTIYRTDVSEPIGETDATETTFTDPGLAIGTYFYIVEANYYNGVSVPSNPVRVDIEEDGITENTANVILFPNPAKETIHIAGKQITEVSIFNIYGQEVVKTTVENDNIDLNVSKLSAGVYVVKTITKSGSNIQSVVVK